jgi:hypothetical protein
VVADADPGTRRPGRRPDDQAPSARWFAAGLRAGVERHAVLLTVAVGLAIAGIVVAYAAGTGHDAWDVLGSGETAIGPLLQNSADYSVGALLMLLVCKGLVYGLSLSSFRGGPVFPAMFIGAAGGIAMSHLPGLPMVSGTAMGIGAMCVVMLRLPLTSLLLAVLLMYAHGLAVMPLAIVAVVVAHVLMARLPPSSAAGDVQPAVGAARSQTSGGTCPRRDRDETGSRCDDRASDRPVSAGSQPRAVDRRRGAARRRERGRARRFRDVQCGADRRQQALVPPRRPGSPASREPEVAAGQGGDGGRRGRMAGHGEARARAAVVGPGALTFH